MAYTVVGPVISSRNRTCLYESTAPPRDSMPALFHLGLYHTWGRNLRAWLHLSSALQQRSVQGVPGLRLRVKKCPLDPNFFLFTSPPPSWTTRGPGVPSGSWMTRTTGPWCAQRVPAFCFNQSDLGPLYSTEINLRHPALPEICSTARQRSPVTSLQEHKPLGNVLPVSRKFSMVRSPVALNPHLPTPPLVPKEAAHQIRRP